MTIQENGFPYTILYKITPTLSILAIAGKILDS
jgi:hypothetical protein